MQSPDEQRAKERKWKWFVGILVLIGAALAVVAMLLTKHEPERTKQADPVVPVEVVHATREAFQIEVPARGTVIPAKRVMLAPEVAGRITWQSEELTAGGSFRAGDAIVRLDTRDYALGARAAQADLKAAQLALALEKSRGAAAKYEWDEYGDTKVGTSVDEEHRDLALRRPQLETARIGVEAAQSKVDKAELDLARTTVRAPFNAMVVVEHVDPGQLVSPQAPIAELVGTDEFHVQLALPVEDLARIKVATDDAPGARVSVTQQIGDASVEWTGEVIRQLPDLDQGGGMARVVARILEPMSRQPPLLLGSFVSTKIQSTTERDVIVIPREALHDGKFVYVIQPNGTLGIREVQVAWTTESKVLVREGITDDDLIVTTQIPTAVPGTKLRVDNPSPETRNPKAAPVPANPTKPTK